MTEQKEKAPERGHVNSTSEQEAAAMIENEKQISQDADLNEEITLTRKQLYCATKHVQSYLKLGQGDKRFILPCRVCKYLLCCDETGFKFRQSWMDILSQKTGVTLSFWRNFKLEELPDYLLELDSYQD